jgi:hypothetical protein
MGLINIANCSKAIPKCCTRCCKDCQVPCTCRWGCREDRKNCKYVVGGSLVEELRTKIAGLICFEENRKIHKEELP